MKASSVLVLIVLIGPVLSAQDQSSRPAWQWSDEQRITARTLVSPRHPLAAQSTSASDHKSQFMIDGAKNPELFMPSELYNSLTYGLWEDERSRSDARSRYRPVIQRFGWDEDVFWSTLETLDRRHQELQRRLLSDTLSPEQSMKLSIEACAAQALGFRAAKSTFGRDKFVEFLYAAVAPDMSITAKIGVDEQRRLRWVEGGCQ